MDKSQRLLERREFELQGESESEMTDYDKDPHIYSNYWEYLFSIVGLTVGFGSFWRFPYLIYKNGGGIFLIPYIIALVVVGVPLLYLETAVGQMHRGTLPIIFAKIHPAFKMLGMVFVISSIHISSVYNIILTYSYRFVISSLNPDLPFADEPITENIYFKQDILQQSASISDFEAINPILFIIYILSLLICHHIIKNGVKASGKVVIFTALSPFVFLIILLIRAFFLEGAFDGLAYLFKPKWSLLFTGQIWKDALVQVFYQLSIAYASIVHLSSMKPKRDSIIKGVYIVPLSIIICGMLSALNIFMYLGHFCHQIGISIDDPALKLSGPELSFNVFPKALALLPWSNLWLCIFFISMVFLGIDSQFGMIETSYCYLKDQFRKGPMQIFGFDITFKRAKEMMLMVMMIGAPVLTSHAGIYYLEYLDQFMCNIPFTVGALIEVYVFVYIFKFEELERQIIKYTGEPTPALIRFFLESKILVIILMINAGIAVVNQIFEYEHYSLSFYAFGWFFSCYPYGLAYWYFRRHWTCKQDLKLTFQSINERQSYL